ncbi:MAG: chemotaxis protein CheD [Planctomycetota bacterium]|mgnify:CR=1 FL=1
MHLPEIELAAPSTRIGIGEGRVGEAGDALRTTLGSCIGVALVWPRKARFGLAHVLLPSSRSAASNGGPRFADTAVEWLLQRLRVPDDRRGEVVAYIAGGASMFSNADSRPGVGAQNEATVRASLGTARIRLKGVDVGGTQGRQMVVHGPLKALFVVRHEGDEPTRWDMPLAFGRDTNS